MYGCTHTCTLCFLIILGPGLEENQGLPHRVLMGKPRHWLIDCSQEKKPQLNSQPKAIALGPETAGGCTVGLQKSSLEPGEPVCRQQSECGHMTRTHLQTWAGGAQAGHHDQACPQLFKFLSTDLWGLDLLVNLCPPAGPWVGNVKVEIPFVQMQPHVTKQKEISGAAGQEKFKNQEPPKPGVRR